jgi:glycosyltransferase involved in cell wall biosynthesis
MPGNAIPTSPTQKVIVVLPAYNAAKTLEKTITALPQGVADALILVDDASQDETLEIARRLASAHPPLAIRTLLKNGGYGANQKECYALALAQGADIIVLLHPDFQYDPSRVPVLIAPIRARQHDIMLGSRIRTRREAQQGGMPAYKYLANRVLSYIENVVTGQSLSDWHSGMRAYSKEALQEINFRSFSDDFIFDTQMLLAISENGYSIGEIPVPVRYWPESSSISFSRSIRYGLGTLFETAKYAVRARLLRPLQMPATR